MRKVKFTQDTFEEKLGAILTEFPMLDVRPDFFLFPVYAYTVQNVIFSIFS
jgi:hypothetical protein